MPVATAAADALRGAARDFSWPEVGPVIARLGHLSINPEHPLGGFSEQWRGADRMLGGRGERGDFSAGDIAEMQSDFHRGVFEVARGWGHHLPVAMSGTHRIWEHPFAPTLRYGQRVTLTVLPPISAGEVQCTPLETLRSAPPGHEGGGPGSRVPPPASSTRIATATGTAINSTSTPTFPRWPGRWPSTAPLSCEVPHEPYFDFVRSPRPHVRQRPDLERRSEIGPGPDGQFLHVGRLGRHQQVRGHGGGPRRQKGAGLRRGDRLEKPTAAWT